MNLIHLLRISLAFSFLMTSCSGMAHEVRPIFLGMKELVASPNQKIFDVIWKQPILERKRLKVDPIFPRSCNVAFQKVEEVRPGVLIRQWQIHCDKEAFQAEPIFIEGLSSTLMDVWINVSLLNGDQISVVIKSSEPRVWLHLLKKNDLSSYLGLGVEHLLTGFDHILFVLGLMYFVKGFFSLLKTVTAFTLAHSITLAGSTYGLISLPQGPVEAAIALSILYLAFEATLPNREQSIAFLKPWLVAFVFGLLHGFGFAGALREIGIPENTMWIALLLFNLGVELGQILVVSGFIVVVYLSKPLLDKMSVMQVRWCTQSPLYVMGSLAAYWFFQRLALLLG